VGEHGQGAARAHRRRLAAAAALLEPKAHTVSLPSVMVKSEAEVDEWLAKVRAKIVEALADGPVIPKI
jgi:hypothetical protein